MSLETPCIKVCALDLGTQMCVGCFRTIDEITRWTQYSDSQRAAILAALSERRARFEARDPAS